MCSITIMDVFADTARLNLGPIQWEAEESCAMVKGLECEADSTSI
jgi:hypothetical protein